MTISRRNALQLAASLAASRALPFAVSPQDAAAMLAEPGTPVPWSETAFEFDLSDPVGFAQSMDGADFKAMTSHGGAAGWAGYKHALLAVEDAVAEGLDPAKIARLLGQLDDDAVDMATLSWMAGVRAGAAYEHLRLALSETQETCDACQGYGRAYADRRAGRSASESADCPGCGGSGIVPAPRPVLTLTAD